MSASVLPVKESSIELIAEVVRKLEPYLPDITARWRQRVQSEFDLDPRALATLEQVTIAAGSAYFSHQDFEGFHENLHYFGVRLAKLQVDTRRVRRALDIYEHLCEPYMGSLFGDRFHEVTAALESFSSNTFVTVAGAYFDARTLENKALISVLDVELAENCLESMLQRVLEITCKTFEAVVGTVLLRDADTDLLKVEAEVGLGGEMRGEFVIQLGQGFSGQIARSGEPDAIIDASRDPRVVHGSLRERAKALWGVPLKHDGKSIGVIVIGFDRPYEWLPTEKELMRAIADRSALAIHRARMTEALREREARIAELSAHLLRVQEEERKRISRELHDETGQGLMVIKLYLDMLMASLRTAISKAKVQETIEVVDRTIVGIRRIIGRLSPLVLQELGLFAAIRKEARDLESNSAVKMRVAISDEVGRLSSETETAIYRIVQEALHNIAKHAQASEASISMTRDGQTIRLEVEDDGVGIFPKANFRGNSFGLAGIKERVGMLGGEVRVISMKGKGTRIQASVPATEPDGRSAVGLLAAQPLDVEGNLYAENKVSAR